MKVRPPILQSKLTPPNTSRTLERTRLKAHLNAIAYKKIALLVAGTGYGKSTLVAQTIADTEADTIWYNLDQSDGDLATFMTHLLAGIQKHKPGLGIELGSKLAVPLVSRESRRKLLLAFLMEIEQHIVNRIIIVLDDYYLIQENHEIAEAIEFLLARMPQTLHFIIISRKDPGLKLSRYRTTMEIIELNEQDLSFKLEEIKSLYQDLLGIKINSAIIEKLYLNTGGWAAALLLFFNAYKGKAHQTAHAELFDIDKSKKLIFKYLEENVVENQSMEIQQFMMRSSLLACLDPDLCDTICDTQNAYGILNDLCENHLLTFPCNDDGDCFQYHQLLKEFLQIRLVKNYGPDAVKKCHLDIAKAMENRDDLRSALSHYVAGEHYREVSRVFTSLVLMDFRDIPIHFLKHTLDKMPSELIGQNARLLFIRAKVMSIGGEIRRAIHAFQIALKQFRKDDDAAGIASCLKELGFHYYLTGDLIRAIQELDTLRNHPHKDPFFPLEVAGYLILFSAIMGDVGAADDYYYASLKKFAVSDTIHAPLVKAWLGLCHGYRFHVAGHFRKADTLNHQALDTFPKMKLENFLPITYFQTALTAYYLANPSQGYEYAQKGMRIATKQGIYDNQYAWLLYARALNGFGLDMGDQSILDAEESLDLFKVFENRWGQALVCECQGMIYSRKGDWGRALDAFQTGLKIMRESDLRRAPGPGPLALGLAEALLENDQLDLARRTLDEHFQNIRSSQFDLFRYHLLRARIENEKDGPDQAIPHIETALIIAKENGYEDWLKPQRLWLTPLLVACHRQNISAGFIEQLFIRADRDADTALCLLRNNDSGCLGRAADRLLKALPHKVPAPLSICCLGSFSVSIGDRPIPKQQWRSAKATLLFKYLAVKNERGMIPKEALLELAWPDEDPAVTNSRLHVALNSLRKLLEPDLKRGVPSAYIIQRNNSYCLEIGQKGRIDFLEFLKAVDQAMDLEKSEPDRALVCSLKAVSLYRGPLLEESPYDQWVAEDRELLQMKYLQTLAIIIRLYEQQEAWHRCIEFCEIYLTQDKFAEPFYRRLMLFYAETGDLPRVIGTFQRCQANINKELGCPLSHITIELHEKIMRAKS